MKIYNFRYRRTFLIIVVFISSLFISCTGPSENTNTNNIDTNFVKQNYKKISISNDMDFSSFSLFAPYLGDNIVFLTGEVHGTVINPKLEISFLKYFKAKAGVRYYLQEMSYSEAIFLNKYLENGDESILKKLYGQLKGAAQWNKEYYEKWIKVYEYNRSLPENQRISVVGIDVEHRFQNAIWEMYSLIPGKEAPAVIKPFIEELKDLYNSKVNYYPSEDSNVIAFSEKLRDSINQYPDEYKVYFGGSLFDLQFINDNILNAHEAYSNMYYFNEVRDKKMYDNFVKIYSRLPEGKYYGQFGLQHVFQRAAERTDWLASLMNSPDSPVKNKVLSTAYVYKDCQTMGLARAGVYTAGGLNDYIAGDGLLEPYINYDLALFRLVGKGSPFEKRIIWNIPKDNDDPPLEGVTTDYYQFLLFIKGSPPTTPLDKQ